MKTRKCLWCGKDFLAAYGAKYCSNECRRKMKRRRNRKYRDAIHPEGGSTIREFCCRMCGTHVAVTDEHDRRTVFCCVSCERKYWKHANLYRSRGRDSNNGMSGGMSLGSLIRRESRALE